MLYTEQDKRNKCGILLRTILDPVPKPSHLQTTGNRRIKTVKENAAYAHLSCYFDLIIKMLVHNIQAPSATQT